MRRNTKSSGSETKEVSFEHELADGQEVEIFCKITVSWSKEEWGTESEQEGELIAVRYPKTRVMTAPKQLARTVLMEVERAVDAYAKTYEWPDDGPDEPEPDEDDMERYRRRRLTI